jgi:hypothetical protein
MVTALLLAAGAHAEQGRILLWSLKRDQDV